ncbi:hypothetical protein [Novosphingobium sp. M1R2S20]|uniref:Lycopene cyclase domain-containing protein n=1 Tax=Novosphingobium rhizovicinum TaxID=3228928 RepID=A0ABV3RDA8_9SPHN
MAENYLLAAALLAVLPAVMGNRTAWALLASYVYACGLEWLGVPFSLPLWIAADLFVLAVIVRPNMSLADELIAVLFLPSWWGYAAEPVLRYEIGMGAVFLQFLLCLPVCKPQGTTGSVSHGSIKNVHGGV